MTPAFHNQVFINCPFDKEYKSLLNPLIFTIVKFGFIPRIASESSDSGTPRLEKLFDLIQECRFSIHDLSRIQSKKSKEYYRLNMPFELGLDYALKKFEQKLADKRFLILTEKPHDYMKAISDINGLDIKNHANDPKQIVECIWSWFIENVGLRNLGSPLHIWYLFTDFNSALFEKKFKIYISLYPFDTAESIAKYEIESLPIPEYLDEVRNFLNVGL